jgi:ribonuclease VapC
MVIDTSALVAISFREAEAKAFNAAIAADQIRLVSAATAFEAAMVIEATLGEAGAIDFDYLMKRSELEIRPVDEELFTAARLAWRRFGKGRHPAALNFGDCFSYALSVTTGEPLLFKGNDFSRTDVRSVDVGRSPYS